MYQVLTVSHSQASLCTQPFIRFMRRTRQSWKHDEPKAESAKHGGFFLLWDMLTSIFEFEWLFHFTFYCLDFFIFLFCYSLESCWHKLKSCYRRCVLCSSSLCPPGASPSWFALSIFEPCLLLSFHHRHHRHLQSVFFLFFHEFFNPGEPGNHDLQLVPKAPTALLQRCDSTTSHRWLTSLNISRQNWSTHSSALLK